MPNNPYPVRKSIRLEPSSYTNTEAICSITICTRNRIAAFSNALFADASVHLMKTRAVQSDVKVFAHCFMPDHVHLLIAPSQLLSVIDFVRELKGLIARIGWSHGFQGSICQRRFFDHMLRSDDDIERAAMYVLNNPVRKGIVREWREYPFCGSLMYDL